MQANVIRVKGIELDIGGTTYIVPPLALGALEMLLPKINAFNTTDGGGLNLDDVRVVVDAAHAAISRNYPDVTREQLAQDIGLENMYDVMQAVMDVSGLRRKQMEKEKEKAAAGEASPGKISNS